MNKPVRVEGIDIDIQLVFRKEHIALVLPHFQRVGLPSSLMDEMIDAYIKSGENVSYERWFLEYGQQVINPLMNQKLGRAKDHPTFNNLLKHALKEIIETDSVLQQFKKFKKPA
jgi:CRISPR/Cas system CSM-associated protein Csm2 small subunit